MKSNSTPTATHLRPLRPTQVINNRRVLPTTRLAISTPEGIDFIWVRDIVFAEARQQMTCFKMVSGESVLVPRSFNNYEQFLSDQHFKYAHGTCLVNNNHIVDHVVNGKEYFVLSDESSMVISGNASRA